MCTCYWDEDCNTKKHDCSGYSQCMGYGKWDGTCDGIQEEIAGADVPRIQATPDEVATAVDLYFLSYLKTARKGGGTADKTAFAQAHSVWLGDQNEALHSLVQEAVHEALDTVLGFDFSFPSVCLSTSGYGNLRLVPPGSMSFIKAVQAGFVNGILAQDLRAIESPLGEFWRSHPNFKPDHTGRYYAHGHEGESHNPQAAQRKALKKILNRILSRMDT